jgi:hypothetical protein
MGDSWSLFVMAWFTGCARRAAPKGVEVGALLKERGWMLRQVGRYEVADEETRQGFAGNREKRT